jgi:hypothetical protein
VAKGGLFLGRLVKQEITGFCADLLAENPDEISLLKVWLTDLEKTVCFFRGPKIVYVV